NALAFLLSPVEVLGRELAGLRQAVVGRLDPSSRVLHDRLTGFGWNHGSGRPLAADMADKRSRHAQNQDLAETPLPNVCRARLIPADHGFLSRFWQIGIEFIRPTAVPRFSRACVAA